MNAPAMEAKIMKLMQRKTSKAPQGPDLRTLLETMVADLDHLIAQREAELSSAVDAVIRHLRKGHNHRAFDRVESMTMTKNMVEALLQVKDYCSLLEEETATILDDHSDCPEELVEAVAGVLFASRKLQGDVKGFEEIREKFTSRFGLDFVRSTSRGYVLVDAGLMERLSHQKMGEEEKLEVIKEIASEEGIDVDLDDLIGTAEEEKMNPGSRRSASTNNETDPSDGIGDEAVKQNIDRSSVISKQEMEEETWRDDQPPLSHSSISSSSLGSTNPSREAIGSKKDRVRNLWNPAKEKFRNAYQIVGNIPKNLSSGEKKSSLFQSFSNGKKTDKDIPASMASLALLMKEQKNGSSTASTGAECIKETSKQEVGEELPELRRSTSSSSLSSTYTLSATASPYNKDVESKKEKKNLSRKLWKPAVKKVKNAYQIMGTIPKNLSLAERKSSLFQTISNGRKKEKRASLMNNSEISAISEDVDLTKIMARYKDAVTAAEEALRLANLTAEAARAAVLLSKYESQDIITCPSPPILHDMNQESSSKLEANGTNSTSTSVSNGFAYDDEESPAGRRSSDLKTGGREDGEEGAENKRRSSQGNAPSTTSEESVKAPNGHLSRPVSVRTRARRMV